jgi:FAD/FMN-containing dehydrogenase
MLALDLDGEMFTPDSAGYDAIRRPVNPAYRDVRPRLVVLCRSVSDVVSALSYAAAAGERLAPRGGGHCFAGRSSMDGILLDLSTLDRVSVADDGVATIGAGARLQQVYAALHAHGRTLPAGCGPTVGVASLTFGGGIGLFGRKHGLTCDRLVGARVVLADATVVDCVHDRHPDLFWALRGAGGGQFGVVTSLRFDTVPEPLTTRIEARWSGVALVDLVAAWQAWAPDGPDELTVNLTLESEPGAPVRATLFGASTLEEGPTRELLLQKFTDREFELHACLPYHSLKQTFAEPDPPDLPERGVRTRSEFFSHSLSDHTLASLLTQFNARGRGPAAAYVHRDGRGLQQSRRGRHRVRPPRRALSARTHRQSGRPVDQSFRTTAHADGSGRVCPQLPDPALDHWATAYHAGNYRRLVAVKDAYDPHRFFDFPQAI